MSGYTRLVDCVYGLARPALLLLYVTTLSFTQFYVLSRQILFVEVDFCILNHRQGPLFCILNLTGTY